MNSSFSHGSVIKVCHIAMGDLWAGAEVQLLATMKYLVRLPRFEWFVILFNEGKLADELRKLGIPVTIIPEERNGVIAISRRLAGELLSNRPDIVHTHKYKDTILGAIVAKYLRVPYVIRVVHGMPEPFYGLNNVKMACYTLLTRLVTSCLVDKVIAVSYNIEDKVVKMYGAKNVVCIHNGIDLESVRVTVPYSDKRKQLNIGSEEIVIGTVGRLVPVKGHEVLIEAAAILLLHANQKVKVLIVGDGPLRENLKVLAARLGVETHVVFVGHQHESYDFINIMDVFVLPSLSEGIPMVLLEALALERPVVASRVGGIPEVVSTNLSGILVDPASPQALVAGLMQIIQDRSKAAAYGKFGRANIEREFSASMMASRTAIMYQSLCNSMADEGG